MVATFIIIKIVSIITPLRVTDSEETQGLDTVEHGESIQH
jgi:Amt family ammonium transporter